MTKFKFVLMTKGYRTKMTLLGNVVDCPKMDAVYHSPVKHVYGIDEEAARYQIRRMLTSKWIGFKLISEVIR